MVTEPESRWEPADKEATLGYTGGSGIESFVCTPPKDMPEGRPFVGFTKTPQQTSKAVKRQRKKPSSGSAAKR